MNKDRLIADSFNLREKDVLPADFSRKMMDKILLEAARKQKQAITLNYLAISVASLLLILVTGFMLKSYLSFDQLKNIVETLTTPFLSPAFKFGLFISIIVLLLLAMDRFFRNLYNKHLNKLNN